MLCTKTILIKEFQTCTIAKTNYNKKKHKPMFNYA
jgi:hypothetical protein